MKYIGYQGDVAAFVRDSREALEAIPCVTFDRIVEVDDAELIGYEVIIGTEAVAKAKRKAEVETAKSTRTEAVAAITVEVDGMVFDGDETAQERMARTVTAATATGASMDDTTVWVLHDNTVAQPTIRQLATALRMAGEAQTALWTVPYEA